MLTAPKQAELAKNIEYGRNNSELPSLKSKFPEVPEVLILLIAGHSGARVAESIFAMPSNEINENASIVLSISEEDCKKMVETTGLLGIDLILETLNRGQFTGVA